MSDLQLNSHFPPSLDDASHAQFMQWDADGHIDIHRSSIDEQNSEVLRAVGLNPSRGQSVDEQKNWRNTRFQGTLPVALSARIPLEIFILIIDTIMYQPTLAAAALVCTTWYPRAMRNLYYSLEIRSRTSLNMLFKQCRASPRVKQWLASTYKLVADEAYYDSDSDSSEDEDGSMESPQRGNKSNSYNHSPQTLPSALAGLMPRLRSLYVGEGGLRFICTDFFLALSKYKSVKSLTLQSCELNNVRQLRRIVCAFPQLTDLTIDVELAQRGAASHAGASLSQLPPHMRLRYLDVVVHEELMAMSVDWMAHSNLCTSLADLTFWSNHPPMARTCLNNLLETAGASLTRFCERYSNNDDRVHGNLSQNTALRSLDFMLHHIKHEAEDQRPGAAWTKATDELHGIFCTIRSRQLEHIEVLVEVHFDDSTLASQQPGVVLEKLDLRDLHEVMRQPYFDTLRSVEVKMYLCPHILQASISQKLKPMFHGILQPWSARGIVTVTYQWGR